jgi:ABC-2 type transport system permease protein
MINRPFLTLVYREVWRFLVLYKQTIMPGIITSALYMVIFGQALGSRIRLENNVEYIIFIIPGITMMSVISQSYANSSSSIMQAKYLKFIDDYLIAPVSGFELSMSFIIGAILRGVINGILIIITCSLFTNLTIANYSLSLFFLVVVSCVFGAVGVIVGIVAKTWDSVGVLGTFVFMPLSMLGGVFWSIDMLPESWAFVALFNPLYWMINGLRYSMIGVSEISIVFSIVVSIIFAIIFTAIASIMFSKGYKIKS